MKDAYVDAFREVIKETSVTTGYELPEAVECYVVMLLASFMDRPRFIPEEGFGRALLTLENPKHRSAKELGDACLFVSGVFPKYGQKYGISKDYYVSIGISSYDIVSQHLHPELFKILSQEFNFVSNFIGLSTCPKSLHQS